MCARIVSQRLVVFRDVVGLVVFRTTEVVFDFCYGALAQRAGGLLLEPGHKAEEVEGQVVARDGDCAFGDGLEADGAGILGGCAFAGGGDGG